MIVSVNAIERRPLQRSDNGGYEYYSFITVTGWSYRSGDPQPTRSTTVWTTRY